MEYNPNNLFQLLEPLPGTDHCWYYFDDEVLCLQVPCEPRPKGSASPVARISKEGKPYIAFIPGSDSKGIAKGKMDEQERKVRAAIAALWKLGFAPYDEGCKLDLDIVIKTPKSRLHEIKHLVYPDRDKLLRAVQDMISPPVEKKTPQLDQPHLVVNDSQIYDGYTRKWWLHTWNGVTGMDDDESGIYICLKP
jgi:hypothetical protein